jgi:hypothetical protein
LTPSKLSATIPPGRRDGRVAVTLWFLLTPEIAETI